MKRRKERMQKTVSTRIPIRMYDEIEQIKKEIELMMPGGAEIGVADAFRVVITAGINELKNTHVAVAGSGPGAKTKRGTPEEIIEFAAKHGSFVTVINLRANK